MKSENLLTVVIAHHQDPENLAQTVFAFAHSPVNIHIINDNDATLRTLDQLQRLHSIGFNGRLRISSIASTHLFGPAQARHYGALHAKTPWCLFTDCHMAPAPDWYHVFKACIADNNPRRLYHGPYYSVDPDNPDRLLSLHYGTSVQWLVPNQDCPGQFCLFHVPFHKEPQPDGFAFAPIGANYIVNTKAFLEMGGLRGLEAWGSSERLLGLKYWLLADGVQCIEPLKIAHKHVIAPEGRTSKTMILANKIFCMASMFPKLVADDFLGYLERFFPGEWSQAMKILESRKPLQGPSEIELNQERLKKRGTLSFDELHEKFSLEHPEEIYGRF